ncbi:MAG: hypothetical protein JWL59_4031 [Chthoniobacteraceae bacterium]|nr:hypothetical protein [Chthoniobacteraceae bacterium]
MTPVTSGPPIVLTATIVPLGSDPNGAFCRQRRAEYLRALRFYLQFARVYFLENSGYDLLNDPDFNELPGLQLRKFTPSQFADRGKGFQEFEMLDQWMAQEEPLPGRWLKITGRYLVINIEQILKECGARSRFELLIDQTSRSEMARTYLFCTTSDFYRKEISGLYKACDDTRGDYIERVLFKVLQTFGPETCRFFLRQPRMIATAGSSGNAFPSGYLQAAIKTALRLINSLFEKRYLLYPK